jgi:peptidylprolyl isomerase
MSELCRSNCIAKPLAFRLVRSDDIRLRAPIMAMSLLMLLSACGSDAIATPTSTPASATACATAPAGGDSFSQTAPLTTTADGLKYGDIVVGSGPVPSKGDNLTVQYTGWLTNGCFFDTSRQAGRTAFQFVIGANPPNVIAGWDEGVLTMHVGGKRRLAIPPALGYGSAGQGPIPPNATLIFDVELLAVGPAPSPSPT